MENNNQDILMDRTLHLLPQMLDYFMLQIGEKSKDTEHWEDAKELLALPLAEEKLEVIYNNPYFSEHWTFFITTLLANEVYKDQTPN